MHRTRAIVFLFCLAVAGVSADTTWNHVSPTPSAANFFGAASGNGKTVVTGMYSTRTSFIVSNAVSNWTEVYLQQGYALRPYTASYLVAFDPAWGFVAVPSALSSGGASFIWSSPDGIEWMWGNQVVSYGNTLVASNGIFLSAGGTDSVYSSHDGGSRWASIPTKSYTNAPTVIGQTFFIPVGDTEVYTSADGINLNLYHNFTSSEIPSKFGRIMSVAQVYGCNDGSVVALISAENGGAVLRSATQQSPVWKVVQTFDYYIGYGYFARGSGLDAIFVSLPPTASKWQYWQSKDHGQTWLAYSDPNIGFGPIVAVEQSFIMFGQSGQLSESLDGNSWIAHTQGVTANIQNAWYSSNLNSLVLATDDTIYSSPTGNFTGSDAAVRGNPHLLSLLEFGSGSDAYFAGVDTFGNLSVSPVSGGHWIVRKGPEVAFRHQSYNANLLAYAEDQDVWVISIQVNMGFSQLPVFYYSSGNKWSLAQSSIGQMDIATTRSLVYGNKLFVALVSMNFNNYRVFTSSNGSLWTMNKDVLIKPSINSVTGCSLTVDGPIGGDRHFFIFCADAATAAYFSRDGLSWKPLALPAGTRYVNYLSGSELWLATGYDWFSTSPDLTNWSKETANPWSTTLFNLAVENPSTRAAAAISIYDNTVIVASSMSE